MMIKLILPGLVLLFSCYTTQSYCKNDQNGNNSMNSIGKYGEISAKCLGKPLPVFRNNDFCNTCSDPLKVISEVSSQPLPVDIPELRSDYEFSESDGKFLTQTPLRSEIPDVAPELAGEEELDPVFANSKFNDENKMAKCYAQEGIIAVAVDNPGIAEASDLEKHTGKIIYDQTTFTRYLIDMAYPIMGADANLAVYHYPMYKDCRNRKHDYETIPEGLDHKEFWEYYNIDGHNHYFKADVVVPRLKDVQKP